MNDGQGLGTRCIHAGEAPDPTTGAHGVPLYQNVTYAFTTHDQVEAMRSGDRPHFTYSPRANPTVRCLEVKLANLEGTETSLALSSGMAAISGTLLTTLAGGGHIVASDQLFDQTRSFSPTSCRALAHPRHSSILQTRPRSPRPSPRKREHLRRAILQPDLRVADLRMVAEVAQRHSLLSDRRQHIPVPSAAAARGTRSGPRDPQRDEVSLRQRAGPGGRRLRATPAGRTDPRPRSVARDGAVALRGLDAPRGIHTLPFAWNGTARTPCGWRACWPHPAIERVNYPGLDEDPGHATRGVHARR